MTDEKIVKEGSIVEVHYTGTLEDGTVFDTSDEKTAEEKGIKQDREYKPLVVTLGSKQVIPGFEKALEGMKEGDEKDVAIESADAYGEVDARLVQEVPKQVFKGSDLKEGGHVVLKMQNGMQLPALIEKVGDDKVTVNLNHPLAGKKLNFNLKVLSIN